MGAQTFQNYVPRDGSIDTPHKAFNAVVEKALYDCGHDGYTGTVAEKCEFQVTKLREGETVQQCIERTINTNFDDKWGPAGCIVTDEGYHFFGWASIMSTVDITPAAVETGPEISELQARAYLKSRGASCPACEDGNIEGGSYELNSGTIYQPMHCTECGAEWDDAYELDRIVGCFTTWEGGQEASAMTWEQWSRAVIDILIDTLQTTNGDAQAVFEAQPVLAMQIWHVGYTPEQAARAIDHASRVSS